VTDTGERPSTVAVVDIGSNSVRLFLCTGWGDDGPEGERTTVITALRRGAGDDGTISPDALERLDACLADYATRIDAFAPDRVVPIATSATRDAPNRDRVEAVVQGRLGTPVQILSGEEEAAYAFAGARLAVEGGAAVTVIDVGGGSTEVVNGSAMRPDHAQSLRVGSVRCTESHLQDDPPTPEQMAALSEHVASTIGPAIHAISRNAAVVGVAGTITTFAAILLGGYDPATAHGFRLTKDDLEATTQRLAALPLSQRRDVPGLHPDRAGVIVAGGIIVAATMGELGATEMLVSERDILDGVARSVLGR
jgi:exopolyphosphatase / guanosine-5'-triphosphate,3'-diphosphate pyrophosphatase